MEKLILLIGAIAIIIAIAKSFGKKKAFKSAYKRKQYFFSIAERKFYETLKEVARELNLELFAKVRLADLIYSDDRSSNWISNWNKIKAKHIDFLLCEKENYTPAVAIELDDSSHLKPEAARGDDLKNKALESAGLKLVRFKVKQEYSKEEIKLKLTA